MIRILLADDQALVRGALAALLDLETDLEVVAQVGRGDEVLAAARSAQVDVCLLDIEMPGLTGLEVAEQLRAELPDARSLIVTTFGRPGYVRRALDAGAAGFLAGAALCGSPAAAEASAVADTEHGREPAALPAAATVAAAEPPGQQLGQQGEPPGPEDKKKLDRAAAQRKLAARKAERMKTAAAGVASATPPPAPPTH